MRKNKILLLEDNPIHREVIYDGLEDAGFEVEKAQNVDEAHKILEEFTPDLFLLDIVIGNSRKQGILFAEELSKESRFEKIPVLYITAYIDERSIADHFPGDLKENVLPKPFDFEQLINKIGEMLN